MSYFEKCLFHFLWFTVQPKLWLLLLKQMCAVFVEVAVEKGTISSQ